MPSGFRKDGGYSGRVFKSGAHPHNAGGATSWITVECEHCGTSFSRRRSSHKRFCSRSCAARSDKHKTPAGWNLGCSGAPTWNKGLAGRRLKPEEFLLCPTCGKSYPLRKRGKATPSKFCSRACYGAYRALAYSGSNSPRFGTKLSPNVRKEISRQMRKLWREKPEVMKKALSCRAPNKDEASLSLFLAQLGYSYKYVGDGSLIIGGKNPDFVSTSAEHRVIELFGERWHPRTDEPKRIGHFQQHGYATLIIWRAELADLATLARKLCLFHAETFPGPNRTASLSICAQKPQ